MKLIAQGMEPVRLIWYVVMKNIVIIYINESVAIDIVTVNQQKIKNTFT